MLEKLLRKLGALLIGGLLAPIHLWGQPSQDNWATADECLKATSALYYYPTVVSSRTTAANEKIRGHPTGGCFEMDLPDRQMKRGFVRIEAGRAFVYDKATDKLLRLAQCNNEVYSWAPFREPEKVAGLVGPMGPPGPAGPQGPQGIPGVAGATGPVATPSALTVRADATATAPPSAKEAPRDYIVRSRGHGKLYTFGAIAIIGTAGWFVWQNNRGGTKTTKGKGPSVTTDSVVVKCIATNYPNNCPPGNRIGGMVFFRP